MPPAPDQAAAAQAFILGKMQAAQRDTNVLHVLARALQALSSPLTAEQAEAALGPILEAIKGTTEPGELRALAEALRMLPMQPDSEQTQVALGHVLDVLKTTEDPDAVAALSRAVQELPVALAPEKAGIVLGRSLKALLDATDPDLLRLLVEPIPGLADKLPPDYAIEGLAELIEAEARSTDSSAPKARIKVQAGRALADRLGPEQVEGAVAELTNVPTGGDEPRYHSDYVELLEAVSHRLSPSQAQALLPVIEEWIGAADDSAGLRDLGAAVNDLAPKLTADQAKSVLPRARSAVAWAGRDDEAETWAGALAALLAHLPGPERVPELAQALKYPMAGGSATGVLLDALRTADPAAPGGDAGLDANLDWLRQAYPALNLDAAPACPEPPPARGFACPTA
jgi:hypothetical protein